MPRPDPSQWFVFGVVLVVVAFYGVVVWQRRRRFERLGSRLGATWTPRGRFDPGTIAGPDFTIEARARGAGGGRTYHTTVRLSARDTPGAYLLRGRFFERFPDFRFALTPGVRRERAFVVTVSFPQYSAADPEERQALLAWLSRRAADAHAIRRELDRLRIRELWVESDSITVRLPGAVSDVDRLQGVIDLLRGLSGSPYGSRP